VAEKQQIAVKVDEDPNRQKLFAAAMAAAAAAANANQPTTSHQAAASSMHRINADSELQQRMDF
jgi:hypothetical protein